MVQPAAHIGIRAGVNIDRKRGNGLAEHSHHALRIEMLVIFPVQRLICVAYIALHRAGGYQPGGTPGMLTCLYLVELTP